MKNLRSLRFNSGISQIETAKRLNITKSAYSRYETGESEPSIGTLIKIADYFNCSVDYLLGHETKGIIHLDSFSPIQQKLVSMVKLLNEDQTKYLVGYCSVALGIPYDDVKPQRPW